MKKRTFLLVFLFYFWAIAGYRTNLLAQNIAANADQATTALNQAITIDVLANDLGNNISIVATTNPAHGTSAINPNGTITYTPDTDFLGTDYFVYQITNQEGQLATTTVAVSVLGSLELHAQWDRNCSDTPNTGFYTVTVFMQGGTPPYNTAGTYNETNITDANISFSLYNSMGFYLVVSDANGSQFIIDELAIMPCMGPIECPIYVACPTLGLSVGSACNDNNDNTQNDVVQMGCVCAGVAVGIGQTVANLPIRIYPNPSIGIVYVEYTPNLPITISVYNAVGQLIVEPHQLIGQKESLDLSSQGNGIYFIATQTADNYAVTKVTKW